MDENGVRKLKLFDEERHIAARLPSESHLPPIYPVEAINAKRRYA